MRAGRKRNVSITMPELMCLDATRERSARAMADGVVTSVIDILTTTGLPSGHKHRLIQCPIETALRRGAIDDAQSRAGDKFLVNMFKAQIDKSTSVDLMSSGGGFSASGGIASVRLENLRIVSEARLSIQPEYRKPWTDWCLRVLTGRAGIALLGEMVTHPHVKCERTNIRVGFKVLRSCLTDLQRYYDC